jgi:hypothetical protein
VRPPRNYDALRQAEQQAREAGDAPSQPEASAQQDSAQPEPTRPRQHRGVSAHFTDGGEPVVPQTAKFDPAEIAREARAREDAAALSKEQDRGKSGQER